MHKHPTRRALVGALASAPLAAGPFAAWAQQQPIRIIVPYPAGGATDMLGRLVAMHVQSAWNTNVVVENKPGASGTIGGDMVAKAAPDGLTVLMSIVALVQLPWMTSKIPFDPQEDLVPVIEVARSSSMLCVPSSMPVKNVKEFIALMKANPGKHSFGSYGIGTSAHIQGSLLNMQAGLDLVHVPYKGSAPLVTDMLGGQLSSAFIDAATLTPHLKTGKIRVLAVTGSRRNQVVPEVMTMAEHGYKDFEPYGWFGMFMPAGTPRDVVAKFNAEAARALHAPEATARIQALGLSVVGNSPQEFERTVRDDAALYGRIIRAANIRLD